MVSIQVLATPISGFVRSSPVKPMALNMARDGARSRPLVIRRLRCFRSIGLEDYDRGARKRKRGSKMFIRETQRKQSQKSSSNDSYAMAALAELPFAPAEAGGCGTANPAAASSISGVG